MMSTKTPAINSGQLRKKVAKNFDLRLQKAADGDDYMLTIHLRFSTEYLKRILKDFIHELLK